MIMLKPLGKNILVRRLKEEKRQGRLILTNEDVPFNALVIDKGSGVELEIEPGDTLLLVPYSGSKISTNMDDEHLLVIERDILGKVV